MACLGTCLLAESAHSGPYAGRLWSGAYAVGQGMPHATTGVTSEWHSGRQDVHALPAWTAGVQAGCGMRQAPG